MSSPSSGRRVFKFTVAPIAPSTRSAVGDLVTSMPERISGFTVSSAGVASCVGPTNERPLISMRFNDRPRTVKPLPSPSLREILIPDTRPNVSATFWSGNLPMSSALTTSTMLDASRFASIAAAMDCRRPVTDHFFDTFEIACGWWRAAGLFL